MTRTMPRVQAVRMYGVPEVAHILGIPVRRLYLHIKVGKFTATRREVDGRLVASGQEVVNYWHKYNAKY